MKGALDPDVEPAAWGKAKVLRDGGDLVIVTYSRQVHHALAAAETLADAQGINAAVIDLRTLNPLDFDTIRPLVEAAGRAMVVSEAVMTCGVAAELSARITEECFDFLEDPVVRVAGEDIPISVSPLLEQNSVPTPGLIVDTARKMFA
jgi:pyruvate dehydrogenase E1 component beta subunit